MINEDDKYIYINDILDLNEKPLKCSNLGSTSNIYRYNDNELIKIFNRPKSINRLCILDDIKLLNLSSFVVPNKFIFINEQYYGYSMNFIKGNALICANKIKCDDLLKNLKRIEDDILCLSLNHIEIFDLNWLNVLLNHKNNFIYIVDLDEYDYNFKDKNLYNINLEEFKLVFFVSICNTFNKNVNNEILDNVRNYFLSIKNNDLSLYELFNKVIKYTENISDKELITISDFRKVLKK